MQTKQESHTKGSKHSRIEIEIESIFNQWIHRQRVKQRKQNNEKKKKINPWFEMRSLLLSDFIYCKRIETVFRSELLTADVWKQKIRFSFLFFFLLIFRNSEHTMKLQKKIIYRICNNTKWNVYGYTLYFAWMKN